MNMTTTIVKTARTAPRKSDFIEGFEEKNKRNRKTSKIQRGKLRAQNRNW